MNNVPDDQTPPPVAHPTLASEPPLKPKIKRRVHPAVLVVMGLVVVVLMGLGVWAIRKPSPAPVAKPTPLPDSAMLKVGTIIDEDGLQADTAAFTPFINYLASQLRAQGIKKAVFIPQTSVADVASLMRQGKMDMYVDSLFPSFVADQLSNGELLADEWKGGAETYHTAIFVKRDSPIKSLADLQGRVLAFDSATSTVGYFLPKAELLQMKYQVVQVPTPESPVPADKIGYALVHASVYDSVQNGTTPAGAESELEIRSHFGSTFDQNYRIIWTSPDVLRFAVSLRGDISPSLQTAINNALLTMNQTPTGKQAMATLGDVSQFTDVGPNKEVDYGEIENLTSYVENEIVHGGLGQ